MTESIEEKELTKKELQAEWIRIALHFANPDCTAKDCYGRGYTGIDTITGKVFLCEKKGCAVFKLKRFEIAERHKQRLRKENEIKESKGNNEKSD